MKKINPKDIINDISEILNESYNIDGSDSEIPQDDILKKDTEPMPEENPEHKEDDIENIDFTKSSIRDDDNQSINSIRKLALRGIESYADDVTNPIYDFYKKIWVECDKLITDVAKKQQIGGKQ